MDIKRLEEVLRESWTKETSADLENWVQENPAWGQCAVTALLVHDYFGGRLLWAPAKLPEGREISHYFNETETGEVIDLTRVQFPEGTIIPEGKDKKKEFPRTKDYVLSYALTVKRYNLLRENVQRVLSRS